MSKAEKKKSQNAMRVGIFVVDLRGEGKDKEPHIIFLLKTARPWNGSKKHDRINFWQQVNGLVEKDKDYNTRPRNKKTKQEAARKAAMRELEEEMGLSPSSFDLYDAGTIPLPLELEERGNRYVFVAILKKNNIEQGDIILSLEHSAGAKIAIPITDVCGFLNSFNVPDPLRLKHYQNMWGLADRLLLLRFG